MRRGREKRECTGEERKESAQGKRGECAQGKREECPAGGYIYINKLSSHKSVCSDLQLSLKK